MNIGKIPYTLMGTIGTMDVVVDGEIIHDVPIKITFVADSTERDTVITSPYAGQFAATYGMASVWQWDGTEWKDV